MTPFAIVGVLVAVLLAIGLAFGDSGSGGSGEGGSGAAPARRSPPATLAQIVDRVERMRGLSFPSDPRPRKVTSAQARREGLADYDRAVSAEERRVEERVFKLLGLLKASDDLREVAGSIFGGQVAGYYDPRTKQLSVVSDAAGSGTRVIDEIVLAHELNHALEDAAIGVDPSSLEEGSADASLAYSALVEGTATALMFEYADLYFGREEALGGILSSGFSAGGEPLPPFVMDQLTFPYLRGRVFAEELYRRSGDNWETLDYALRTRPPASTEQILHPEKWIAIEQPVRVRPFSRIADVLGEGWRRTADDVLGEWATGRWLQSPSAGAGWGGDRYELWERGSSRAMLVMEWTWDTARDAEEFVARARTRLPAWAVAARLGERRTSVVIASGVGDSALAQRVAAAMRS